MNNRTIEKVVLMKAPIELCAMESQFTGVKVSKSIGISVPSLGKGAQWVSPCTFGKPLSTSIYLYLAVLIVDMLRGVKNVTAEHMD